LLFFCSHIMDVLIDYLDNSFLDEWYQPLTQYYAPLGDREALSRKFITMWTVLLIASYLMYLSFASFSWLLVFDKKDRKHPLFLKNQELLEIGVTMKSIPIMGLLSTWVFLGEVYGYSQLHDRLPETPVDWINAALNAFFFLAFTDGMIYWIHRWLHHPILYGPIHKLHHKWVVTTPFASHAFHPLDGFLQSTPYHIYVFIFPMNKYLYLILFALVNFWTISIHDGAGTYNGVIINGADHHTIHHRQFNYNYGQYFTFWDRLCGTHRTPPKIENNKAE